MGFMGKLKTILFDEDVIEVPVDSDELPERTGKKSKKEDVGFKDYHENDNVEEDTITEVKVPKEELMAVEEKEIEEEEKHGDFVFPATEFDFDDVPTRQTRTQEPEISTDTKEFGVVKERDNRFDTVSRYNIPQQQVRKKPEEVKDYRKMLSNDEEAKAKKPFKVTPVISPVFGILEKNYTPDEVVEKRELINNTNNGIKGSRTFGPVSYNDQPIPMAKKTTVVVMEEKTTLKEDLVELNSTISEMINEDLEEEYVPVTETIVEETIIETYEEPEEEIEVPKHSIEDMEPTIEEIEDGIISTDNYDDYEETIQTENYDDYEDESYNLDENANNSIEDAFETTNEFNTINELDSETSSYDEEEEEPLVDLETLIDKKNDYEDEEDDSGLDNTIETDLFNLIDSMYKSDSDDEEEDE